MKAILLAAGRGTRISRMIEEIPKCTLPIDGVPLIRHTVDMLARRNIECCVCVGYKQEKIYEALEGYDVTYYYNPFYDVTNSIASLWFARNYTDDELLLMNADVFMSDEIMDMMINAEMDNVLAIDTSRKEMGDYFFSTTSNGVLKKYGKELPLSERTGEYVGIAKVGRSFLGTFWGRLEEMINTQQHQRWWENVLYSLTEEYNINTLDVNKLFWSEIDYFDDYERILNYIRGTELQHE